MNAGTSSSEGGRRVTDNKAILELHKFLDALVLVHGIVVRDNAFAINGRLLALVSGLLLFRSFITGSSSGKRDERVSPVRKKAD